MQQAGIWARSFDFNAATNNFLNFAEATKRVNLTLLPTNFAGQTAVIPEVGAAMSVGLSLGLALLHRRCLPSSRTR